MRRSKKDGDVLTVVLMPLSLCPQLSLFMDSELRYSWIFMDPGLLSCRATHDSGNGTRRPYVSVQADETDSNDTSTSH